MKTRLYIIFSLLVIVLDCGGSTGGGGRETTNNTGSSINTEKLLGTPFEGLTTGDTFPEYTFLCDQYRTETIDAFPILIFVAFFTPSEELIIQEGIDLANEGMGYDAYQLTDVWSDEARVIYKVDEIDVTPSARGHTFGITKYFDSLVTSRKQEVDWIVEVTQSGTNKWTIAHELGHASGISSHALIDYENNTLVDLEENSLMESTISSSSPALTDYNFMMQMQGQIMLDHLGVDGTLSGGDCDLLREFYGD